MNVSNINNKPILAANFSQRKQNDNRPSLQHVALKNVSVPLIDKNYAQLQTKNINVSFKGLPPVPTKTLGEKVGNLFNIVRSNDVIIAAPSVQKAVTSIEKNIESFKTVFKRMFFIEDKTLAGTLGFKKNLGEKEVVNLTEKPIFIKDAKGQTAFLKSGENGFLLEGDVIQVADKNIVIKEQQGIDLPVKNSFDFMVELDKDVEPTITQINLRSLSRLKEQTGVKSVPQKIMFSDVGGQDKAIAQIKRNIIYPIKYPELRNGKNMNKSAILAGPPGTGKSLLAEATANESGAWFKKINASELDCKWVGESEENWRNLFEEARENQPSLIFIDEIDAIAKKRGGHDVYADKTLNTILGLMSDAEKRGDEIYMVAATNNLGAIDKAATRSGRFGIVIEMGTPDLAGTSKIFDIHTKSEPLAKDLNKNFVVEKLHKNNATGADIASITETARTNALEREKIYEKIEQGTYTPDDMKNLTLTTQDFEKAIDDFAQKKTLEGAKKRNPIGYNSALYQK